MRVLLALVLLLPALAFGQTYTGIYSSWMPWDPRIKYTGTVSLLDASGAEVNKTALNSLLNKVTVVFPVQTVAATVTKMHVSLTAVGTNDKGVADLDGTLVLNYTLPTTYLAVAGSNPTFVYTPMAFSPTLVATAPMPAPPADTIPPTVSITAPLAGATVVGTNSLTASASDNVGVAGVQFQIDGANFSAEITAPPYATVWSSTTVADGAHTIGAKARDAAGNITTSALVSVKVSNAPPPAPSADNKPGDCAPTPFAQLTLLGSVYTISGGKVFKDKVALLANAYPDLVSMCVNGTTIRAFNSSGIYETWNGTTKAWQ